MGSRVAILALGSDAAVVCLFTCSLLGNSLPLLSILIFLHSISLSSKNVLLIQITVLVFGSDSTKVAPHLIQSNLGRRLDYVTSMVIEIVVSDKKKRGLQIMGFRNGR